MAGASGGLNRSRRPDVRQRPASPRIPARLWTGTDQPRSTGQASTSRVSARQFPPSQEVPDKVPDRHRPDPWVAAKCRHRRAARRSGRAPTWRLGTDLEVGDRHQPTACRLAKSRHRREVVDRHQPDPRITVSYRHRRASRISGRAPTWRLWTGTDQPRPSPSPEVVDRHQPHGGCGQASTSIEFRTGINLGRFRGGPGRAPTAPAPSRVQDRHRTENGYRPSDPHSGAPRAPSGLPGILIIGHAPIARIVPRRQRFRRSHPRRHHER